MKTMPYLIITFRSLLWMLLSIIASLVILGSIASPVWLVTSPKNITFGNETIVYTPSEGVYAKCSKPFRFSQDLCTAIGVRGLNTDSSVYPAVWKASLVFLALGLTVMAITVFTSLASCCYQSVFRKSIFTMSGAAQSFAGVCFIIGIMLYPMGWGSARVQRLCGKDASPFYTSNCSLGIGLGLAVLGTVLTLISACLSVPAEKSTSSDKVQDKIFEGKTLICLP